MSWEQRFRKGSFRGVSFEIEESDDTFGRRTAQHEFPGKNVPYVQDLGRKGRKFSIQAFIVGDDYLERRDAMIIAVEEEGSGELVHPYQGTLQVQCIDFHVRNSSKERRMCRISFDFVEVGDFPLTKVTPDTQAKLKATAEQLVEDGKSTFEKLYDLAGEPYAKIKSVRETILNVLDTVEAVRSIVNRVAEFPKEIENAVGTVDKLMLSAINLADEIYDLITFGFFDDILESIEGSVFPDTLSERYKLLLKDIERLFSYNPYIEAGSDNTTLIVNAVKLASTSAYGYAIANIEFTSIDEALSYRDKLINQIDALLSEEISDDIFSRLETLRSHSIKDIDARSAILPRISKIVLPQTSTSLDLTNQLYGALDNEQSLLSRNNRIISHPGFIPGGEEISVLLNVK